MEYTHTIVKKERQPKSKNIRTNNQNKATRIDHVVNPFIK